MHLPNNIKKVRKLTRLTQIEFAKKMNVTEAMQKSYEGGKASPDIIYMSELERISGFSAKDLMEKDINVEKLKLKVEKVENVKANALPPQAKELFIPGAETKNPDHYDRDLQIDILSLYRQQLSLQTTLLDSIQEIKGTLGKLTEAVSGLSGLDSEAADLLHLIMSLDKDGRTGVYEFVSQGSMRKDTSVDLDR